LIYFICDGDKAEKMKRSLIAGLLSTLIISSSSLSPPVAIILVIVNGLQISWLSKKNIWISMGISFTIGFVALLVFIIWLFVISSLYGGFTGGFTM